MDCVPRLAREGRMGERLVIMTTRTDAREHSKGGGRVSASVRFNTN